MGHTLSRLGPFRGHPAATFAPPWVYLAASFKDFEAIAGLCALRAFSTFHIAQNKYVPRPRSATLASSFEPRALGPSCTTPLPTHRLRGWWQSAERSRIETSILYACLLEQTIYNLVSSAASLKANKNDYLQKQPCLKYVNK